MTTLQFLRGRARLRQTDLAERLSATQPQISLYETGRPIPIESAMLLLATFRDHLGESLDVGPILRKLEPSDLERGWEEVLSEVFSRPFEKGS